LIKLTSKLKFGLPTLPDVSAMMTRSAGVLQADGGGSVAVVDKGTGAVVDTGGRGTVVDTGTGAVEVLIDELGEGGIGAVLVAVPLTVGTVGDEIVCDDDETDGQLLVTALTTLLT